MWSKCNTVSDRAMIWSYYGISTRSIQNTERNTTYGLVLVVAHYLNPFPMESCCRVEEWVLRKLLYKWNHTIF